MSGGANFGVEFSFRAAAPESGAQDQVDPADVPEHAPPEPPGPPRAAIRTVARAARTPSAAAGSDVARLMQAAGLEDGGVVDVILTTPEGIWVALHPDHPIIVGRSDRDVHLTVSDPGVSRRHCKVARTGSAEVTVEDLASANGTWVHRDRQQIPVEAGRPTRLEDGDWLRSGPDVLLAYVAVVPHAE